jgi:glycosyltransferase involved in cell wall biosynthesis
VNISVVVPVFNSPAELSECLDALSAASQKGVEIIVVDDCSTDHTPIVAAAHTQVRVVRMERNSGPAAARNRGASEARGSIIFFVDADVVVALDSIDRVARTFAQHPDVAAVFGSYDAHPAAKGTVSQYRNLLHHFVHQHANQEASTFWAGCGAIRRSVFEVVGGFDAARFRFPSIEDIELGLRVRRAGYRILLDKQLQGTHLKRWTLLSVIKTDVTRRALPWARLILESGGPPDDLNLKRSQRVSGALVALACTSVPLMALRLEWGAVFLLALAVTVSLNWELYGFFRRQGGLFFAAACIPLHLLYYLYSVLSYGFAWADQRLGGPRMRSAPVRRLPVVPPR